MYTRVGTDNTLRQMIDSNKSLNSFWILHAYNYRGRYQPKDKLLIVTESFCHLDHLS